MVVSMALELSDAPQRFGSNRRAGCLMHLIEPAPRMGPARCQLDFAAGAEALKPRIAIDLDDAPKPRQMRCWTVAPTIRTIEIDSRRWIRAAPGPVIPRLDPEPASLSAATTGIDWDRRIVGE
jgi:hypothetical protein